MYILLLLLSCNMGTDVVIATSKHHYAPFIIGSILKIIWLMALSVYNRKSFSVRFFASFPLYRNHPFYRLLYRILNICIYVSLFKRHSLITNFTSKWFYDASWFYYTEYLPHLLSLLFSSIQVVQLYCSYRYTLTSVNTILTFEKKAHSLAKPEIPIFDSFFADKILCYYIYNRPFMW